MSRNRFFTTPYTTHAKYKCYCHTCGVEIEKGEIMVYDKIAKEVHCYFCGDRVLKKAEREFPVKGYDLAFFE